MRARSCLKVFLLFGALLQLCSAEVCTEDSPEELVALQAARPAKKKGGLSASPKRKKARSLLGEKGTRLESELEGKSLEELLKYFEHEFYEGTSESEYENILAKQGTSLGMEKCTIPKSLKARFKVSTTLGFASKGARSLLEMMDAPPLRKPFSYIRYGDVEWACALGLEEKAEGSRTERAEEIHKAICDKLLEDVMDFGSRPSTQNRDAWNLFVGVGTGHLCQETNPDLHTNVNDFLKPKEKNVQAKFNGWVDSFYLPLVPSKETAGLFLDRAVPLLNGRKVVTVGPEHFLDLERLTHRVDHIAMHRDPLGEAKMNARTFWKKQGEVYGNILNASKQHPHDNVVFLVSGGLPAKILMYKAYRTLGHKDTFIDVGTSLDIFTGNGWKDWNQDTGKVCRDYSHYTEGSVCMNAIHKRMKHQEREERKQAKEGKKQEAHELIEATAEEELAYGKKESL